MPSLSWTPLALLPSRITLATVVLVHMVKLVGLLYRYADALVVLWLPSSVVTATPTPRVFPEFKSRLIGHYEKIWWVA